MILATHGIVGAAMARVFGWHPLAGFIAAVASHYFLDVLPHWDYNLKSRRHDDNFLNDNIILNRDFVFDFIKIALDGLFGFFVSFAIFRPENEAMLILVGLGAIGGVLPDFLQFVYFKFRRQPLIWHQRFHHWIHTDLCLDNRPIAGITLQILVSTAFIAVSYFFAP